MLHGSTGPGLAGSELIRLLSRLAGTSPSLAPSSFAERLGQWLAWNDAIALTTTAINGRHAEVRRTDAHSPNLEQAEFVRVRAALNLTAARIPPELASNPTEFAPYGHHIVARQQAMHTAVAALRRRLRAALASTSASVARLAALDELLERSLVERERSLLGLVPIRLQSHFERLRGAGAAAGAASGVHDAWLKSFLEDMRLVLSAELEHRLLPAQGLLAALLQTREQK